MSTDFGANLLSDIVSNALPDAYLVNPYDRSGVKAALCRAVEASPAELALRMRAMRTYLRRRDVWGWARTFLAALDEARSGPR